MRDSLRLGAAPGGKGRDDDPALRIDGLDGDLFGADVYDFTSAALQPRGFFGRDGAAFSRRTTDRFGRVRVVYYPCTAEGALILRTLYAKSKTDNLTGPKLKEIRRALAK